MTLKFSIRRRVSKLTGPSQALRALHQYYETRLSFLPLFRSKRMLVLSRKISRKVRNRTECPHLGFSKVDLHLASTKRFKDVQNEAAVTESYPLQFYKLVRAV